MLRPDGVLIFFFFVQQCLLFQSIFVAIRTEIEASKFGAKLLMWMVSLQFCVFVEISHTASTFHR